MDYCDLIKDYYKQNDISYQHWGKKGAYEMHFGYKDNPRQNHFDTLTRMNQVLGEKAQIKKGDYVLDAGSGVGASAIWIAQEFDTRVHGISLSGFQVKKSNKLAREYGVDNLVTFSTQDFVKTDFPDDHFDVVWALESACYAEDKRDLLQEAYRLLKPRGRMIVADYFLTKQKMTEVEQFCVDRWTEGWVIPSLEQRDVFKRYVSSTGFGSVSDSDITPYISESSEEIYRRGKEGYPDDLITKSKNVLQIKHVQACLYQKIARDMGLWRYIVVVAQK